MQEEKIVSRLCGWWKECTIINNEDKNWLCLKDEVEKLDLWYAKFKATQLYRNQTFYQGVEIWIWETLSPVHKDSELFQVNGSYNQPVEHRYDSMDFV